MNILVLTPLYYIEGRENLIHDTSSIHYLIRPWAEEHRVKVVDIYINSIRHVSRYLRGKERRYHKEGYFYSKDGVDVAMIEVQNGYRQRRRTSRQNRRIENFIRDYLKKDDFEPELIVYHIPSSTGCLSDDFYPLVPKVAVLHETDLHNYDAEPRYAEELKKFRSVYCRSVKLRESFARFGFNNVRKEIVYSGAPITRADKRIADKPESFRFLYAGKLIARKGVDVSIRALAMLQDRYDFRLDIYGEGKELSGLKKLADRELDKDKIAFHPFVKREQVLELMGQSDVFLMPSTGETFGLVYVEAMSQGCIPVGVKGEGIDGVIVSGKNGFLVEGGNAADLAACIETIMTMDREAYGALIERVQADGLDFSEENIGRRYLNLITSSE